MLLSHNLWLLLCYISKIERWMKSAFLCKTTRDDAHKLNVMRSGPSDHQRKTQESSSSTIKWRVLMKRFNEQLKSLSGEASWTLQNQQWKLSERGFGKYSLFTEVKTHKYVFLVSQHTFTDYLPFTRLGFSSGYLNLSPGASVIQRD